MVRKVRITTARGDWVATVGDASLAVLHNSFWDMRGGHYAAEHLPAEIGGKRHRELLEALRSHDRIVMQRDRSPEDLTREGYVGVFRTENVVITDTGIALDIVERLAESF